MRRQPRGQCPLPDGKVKLMVSMLQVDGVEDTPRAHRDGHACEVSAVGYLARTGRRTER